MADADMICTLRMKDEASEVLKTLQASILSMATTPARSLPSGMPGRCRHLDASAVSINTAMSMLRSSSN